MNILLSVACTELANCWGFFFYVDKFQDLPFKPAPTKLVLHFVLIQVYQMTKKGLLLIFIQPGWQSILLHHNMQKEKSV